MQIRITPQNLNVDSEAFSELLASIDREGVRVVVTGRIARTAQQEVALLALAARGARVVTARGRDLAARAVSPAVALNYGAFEKMREMRLTLNALRAKRTRREKLQTAWREMSAAVRACPLDSRAQFANQLC